MKRSVLLYLILCTLAISASAQGVVHPEDKPVDMDNPTFVPLVHVGKVLEGGDSIQYMQMNNVYVFPKQTFSSPKAKQKYDRMVYNVKRVLPLAKEAKAAIIETYEYIQTLPDKKARDEHLKYVEKSVKKEYTPRIKKLTYTQGKILIKLIYRECNSTSYDIIKAFLGPVRATFWQAFAGLFGASLKKQFDPNDEEDRQTERIVLLVEAGQL
ncbi:MAG: DUF4294 domain-containing protein [Prevotellaceae bacterium]|nr:DUF4294 domain-containing protein [Prevotellaceae bacterium]